MASLKIPRKRSRLTTTAILVAFTWATHAHEPDSSSITDLFAQVRNTVVTIETSESLAGGDVVEASGSGVFVSTDGLVVTAAHVVQVADEIKVRFSSGKSFGATVESSAPGADLALLRLTAVPSDVEPAELGDSNKNAIGERVFVVVAPLEVSQTLSVGYLSGRREATFLMNGLLGGELFQTDVTINSGNSGGPMFDMNGRIIGIVSYSIVPSDAVGINFVVTSNTVREFLFSRPNPWTGLEGRLLDDDLARIVNAPHGILVQRVVADSPAGQLGIRGGIEEIEIRREMVILGGDVILEVGGTPLKSRENLKQVRELFAHRSAKPEGDRSAISIKVQRSGKVVELTRP